MVIVKKCTGICGLELEVNKKNFKYRKSSKDGFRDQCRKCQGKGIPSHIIEENGIKYQICTGECKLKKELNEDNFSIEIRHGKSKYLRWCIICIKKYYKNKYNKNKKSKNICSRQYYKDHRQEILEQKKKYSLRPEIKIKKNKSQKNRRKKNLNVRIHHNISVSVRKAIKSCNSIKSNSILDYLPYTIEELKKHIESLFEPWMNWGNYGAYNSKNIKDSNDKSTWKWHIDHKIAQTKLPYDSMEHPNFIKCWNLNNLQPLEGEDNIRKSNK